MRAKIEYLSDTFSDNRHGSNTLQKIINSFEKKTCGTNNSNNGNNTNKKQKNTLLWIPKIRPKIKKEMQKFGLRVKNIWTKEYFMQKQR